jgi:hypothetical protein
MRTVRRRIYAAHLTVCRGIIEQLEQVEIDAFPTAFVTRSRSHGFRALDTCHFDPLKGGHGPDLVQNPSGIPCSPATFVSDLRKPAVPTTWFRDLTNIESLVELLIPYHTSSRKRSRN